MTDHPFNDWSCITRLKEEYDKYKSLVIGFDFDNTVFDYYNKGGNYTRIINLLKECKDLGFTLCLWTLEPREDWLDWKIKYCEHFGFKPDYINDSPILQGAKKPFFNLLLDDRAGLESAITILTNVVEHIRNEKINDSLQTVETNTCS